VSAATGLLQALADGAALGLQFNPVTALVSSVIAAVLMGYPTAPDTRRPLAVAVLALAWLAGDAARIGRVAIPAGTGDVLAWAAPAAWALVGIVVGYVLPAAAGIGVGTRVVRGTGWLSAGFVAATVAGALALVAPALAEGLRRLTGLG
jgi:hypothetical protein